MDNDKRKKVYDVLTSQTGYKDSFEDFNKFMNDRSAREKVYGVLRDKTGYKDSFDDFENFMSDTSQGVETASVVPQQRPSLHEQVDKSQLPVMEDLPWMKNTGGQNGMLSADNLGDRLEEAYKRGDFEPFRHREEDARIRNEYTPRQVVNEADIMENTKNRFALTERGRELGNEFASIRKEKTDRYLEEFKNSDEYKAIVSRKPETQEEADAVNNAVNELFSQKYGARLEEEMQPYNDAYHNEVLSRYGAEIKAGLTKLGKKSTSEQVAGLTEEVNALLEKEHEVLKQHGGSGNNAMNALMGSAQYNQATGERRKEIGALESARKLLENSREIINEAGKAGNTNFAAGLIRGVRDNFDADKWTFGLAEMADAKYLNNALEKSARGETLTPAEEKLLDASTINMAAQAYFSSDLGRGYKAGSVTAESLPFMLEFLVNPISGSGNTIAKGLLKYGLKRFGSAASTKGARIAGRMIGDSAAALGMEGTTGIGRVAAGTLHRLNQNYETSFNDDGEVEVKKTGDMGIGEALARSGASTFLENQSEMIFNAFRAGGKAAKKAISDAAPGMSERTANRIIDFYNKVRNNKTLKSVSDRAQFHGLLEEYGEEVYNNMANVAIGEMSAEDAFDVDNNIDTFLGLAPTSLAFATLGIGGLVSENIQAKKRLRKFVENLNEEGREVFSELWDEIEKGHDTIAKAFVKRILTDESLSAEEKKDRIFSVRDMINARNTEQEIGEAENETVVATEEVPIPAIDKVNVYRNFKRAERKVAQLLPGISEEMLNSITDVDKFAADNNLNDAQKAVVSDYVSAREPFGAYLSDTNTSRDAVKTDARERASADVDKIINKDNGFVVQAKHKFMDNPVYITRGNLVFGEDGLLDKEKTSEIVYYRDENGDIIPVSPDKFDSILSQNTKDELVAEAEAQADADFVAQEEESLASPDIPVPERGVTVAIKGENYLIEGPDEDNPGNVLAYKLDANGEIDKQEDSSQVLSLTPDEYYSAKEAELWNNKEQASNVASPESVMPPQKKILPDGRLAVQTGADESEVSFDIIDENGNVVDSDAMPVADFSLLNNYLPETEEIATDIPISEIRETGTGEVTDTVQGVNTSENQPRNESTPKAEESKVSEEGQVQDSQEETPEQKMQHIIDSLPKKKDGKIDYKALTPRQQYDYTSVTESEEVAASDLREEISAREKELRKMNERLTKVTGGERAEVRDAIRERRTALDELQSFYNTIVPASIEQQAEVQDNSIPNDLRTDEDYISWVADNSDDVKEVADAYAASKELASHEQTLKPWQRELLGRRISSDSFNRFGDRNHITGGLAKAWLRKNGEEIDTLAQELSTFGGEVTEQDIVDFILANPSNRVSQISDDMRNLSRRFSEIASKELGFPVGGPESNTGKLYLQLKEAKAQVDNLTDAQEGQFVLAVAIDMDDADSRRADGYYESLGDYAQQYDRFRNKLDAESADEAVIQMMEENNPELYHGGFTADELDDIYSQIENNNGTERQAEDSRENQSPVSGEEVEQHEESGASEVIGTENSEGEEQNSGVALNLEGNSVSLQEDNQKVNKNDEISESIPQGEHGTETSQDGGLEEALAECRRRSSQDERYAQANSGTLSERERKEIENRAAENYAKEKGVWIPMQKVFSLGAPAPSGNENDVYLDTKDNSVYKVNNLMNSGNVTSLLERLNLHNEYFPDTKYELVGFSGFENGDVFPVLKQRYIEGADFATPEDIDGYMRSLGFKQRDEATYSNGDVTISDLRPRNVLKDADGDIYVIDADFKKESGFAAPSINPGENVLDYAERILREKGMHDVRRSVNTNPTEAQKEAGNYKKGHLKLDGYNITIENPKGSVRSGTDANGQAWSVTMNNDYGYIRGTKAVDGDHIDIFLSDTPMEGSVFVVDQNKEDGTFDESKVMYGFTSAEEARTAYLSNYSSGWENRIGGITEVSKDEFKKWISSSVRKTKPFADYKSVKTKDVQSEDIDTALEELGDIEQEWEDRILDYIAEHYPTQATVSAQTNSPEGLKEREAMKNDETLKKMRAEADAAFNAADEKVAALFKKENDNIRFREEESLSEEEEIVTQAKANGTYMKAPNGKPSNLDESQWMQVRTQAFKKWFGDWEKAARIEKLRSSKSVEITGEEYKGRYELNRESAQKYILDNLRGEYAINDTGERVKISKKGAKKVTSHSQGSEAHMQSIVAIPEMIGNSIFIEERPAYKDNAQYDSYRYYVTGLKIGGEDYTARITIGVKNGEFYYDHYLTDIEKGNLIEVAQSFKPTEDAPNPSYADNKDNVLFSLLQTNSSKVVDENGEPLVVYHGTTSKGFTKFDKEKIGNRYSFDERGFFFISKKSIADDYANSEFDKDKVGEVIPVFINSKQPLIVNDKWLRGQEMWGVFDNEDVIGFWDVYQSFVLDTVDEEKSDGVFIDDGANKMVVAFEPNQIKSATVNVGTFSLKTDDIRYREEEVQSLEIKKASIASSVNELSESLHTPVSVFRTMDELPEGPVKKSIMSGRNVKAWTDLRAGDVSIYLPNATSTNDAVKSVLHEVVGHKGLRELLGKEGFDGMMEKLYGQLPDDIKKRVNDAAETKYNGSIAIAMDEYLAEQAEKDETPLWWSRVVSAVRDFLRKLGIDVELSANDVKYLLWKSKNRLMSTDNGIALIGKIAADESMKERFHIGEYSRTPEQEKADYDRAARVVSDFAHNHAGAADVLVIRSRDMMRKQLAAVGVSEEDSAKYEQWFDNGDTHALWAPKYKKIFILDTSASENDLNGYLWHENVHKALYEVADYDEIVSSISDYVKKEIPELYNYVYSLYGDEGEYTVKEECVSHLIEALSLERNGKIDSSSIKKNEEKAVSYIGNLLDIINHGKEKNVHKDGLGENIRGRERNDGGNAGVERQDNESRKGTEEGKESEGRGDEDGIGEDGVIRFRDTTDDGMPDGMREAYEKVKSKSYARISSLEKEISKLKDREELRRAVTEFIRKEISSDIVGYLDKKDLNSLLVQAQNAKSNKSLEKIVMNVKNVALNAQRRKMQRMIDKLLSLQVQDRNGKNMSVAKNVDDSTRKIFSYLRGKVSNLVLSGFEDEMKYLRRAIRDKRQEMARLNNLLETTKKETDKQSFKMQLASLTAEVKELKSKLQSVQEESEAVKEHILNTGDMDIDGEMERLNEKMDNAARGKDTWTQGDTERMAALNILQGVITNKKHDGEIEGIEVDKQKLILNNSDLYRKRIGKNETERKRLTEQINENHRRIVAYDRLMNDIRFTQVKQMEMTIEELNELISNGKNSLMRRMEEEMKRKRELVGGAIRSVEGKKIDIFDDKAKKEQWFKKFFSAPLGSFEYMCKRVNTRTFGKDGFLYKHFIAGNDGVLKAYDTYIIGMKEFRDRLNDKCEEIFGNSFERITSLSDKTVAESGVYIMQSEDEDVPGYGVRHQLPLTKGQAMYIYQVWKMNDGRTKLELQGFDEESISQIIDFIGPEYVKFADWVQDEFLKDLREKYNAKYIEMYNTSLADIENYIPLKIRKEAIRQDSSLSEDGRKRKTLEEKAGSLINRTANTKPVDITYSGFDVLMEHGNQMEEWNAYARVRKDLDYVLSSITFRNQLNANVRGSYENFYEAAEVATKANHPDVAKYGDAILGKISKGIVGGNIAFRLNTALKQVLSAPAFLGYSQSPLYMSCLAKAFIKPYNNFHWCMKNIPSFYERVKSGTIGNEKLDEKGFSKLMDKYIEVGMIPNKLVDAITCSLGAKSIYDYKLSQLKKAGTAEEEAHNQALVEADIYYNATQQSSHPAFLSPMQMSRTFTDRMLTTYQNSNIGYARKVMATFYDLTRSLKWKELKRNYTDMYIKDGLSEAEAESKAYRKLLNENRKNVVELALFGWGLNLLWNIGSQGLLGFFRADGDDDDDKWTKDLAFALTSPMKGTPGGNLLESIVSGYGMNPFLVYDELDRFMKEASKAVDEYGLISPEIAYITLTKTSRYAGVDLEVWGNIYLGVEGMARDGALSDDKLIDLMYILNAPKSSRTTVAREVYKNEPILDYAEKIARAYKYIPKKNSWENWVPGVRTLTKRKENEIKKEADRMQMTPEKRKEADKDAKRKKHLRKMKELADDSEAWQKYREKHKEEIAP